MSYYFLEPVTKVTKSEKEKIVAFGNLWQCCCIIWDFQHQQHCSSPTFKGCVTCLSSPYLIISLQFEVGIQKGAPLNVRTLETFLFTSVSPKNNHTGRTQESN